MKKLKITGQLRSYIEWPLVLVSLWAAMTILLFVRAGIEAGLIGFGFLVLYLVLVIMQYLRRAPKLMNELISFATDYGQVQKKMLQEFSLPYALLDSGGCFLWMNDSFAAVTGKERHYHKNISVLFPEISSDDLPLEKSNTECRVESGGRVFRADLRKIYVDEMMDEESSFEIGDEDCLIAISLFDETELEQLLQEKEDNRIVFGSLFLDNLNEVSESTDDVRLSLLLALVERRINQYFGDHDGIVRKLGQDKYIFVMRKKGLEECEENKFSIIDEVRSFRAGNEVQMTVSGGVGLGSDSYLTNAEASTAALELALGRGGDQIVVKDGYRTRFYGGRKETSEKNTRVKARVKAHALREILDSKNRVIVMGHKLSDIDSIGAAVGICCAASVAQKPAHIVCDDVAESVKSFLEEFRKDSLFSPDLFISSERAKELIGADTALVVVDTNRASYTACEELLHLTNTIVVLDHHRQGDGRIQNAVLSYIEPYASSACEMVAEVLQYFSEDIKLKSLEADAMYAGIVIDTNNFVAHTGVRTFEAAAYLRQNGADVTRVRKFFRDDMEDLRAKAKAIADAEIFKDIFAISVCPSEGLKSPTVVCAQAANELLDVVGIKASFVMTEYNEQIYISARAIDELNVQLVMERLGGGGHINIAGAQLTDYTIPEAKSLLKITISEMIEEGDI